ncbi:MAG: O-methyltransferase, partial [Acidimicrobiia bacterium]
MPKLLVERRRCRALRLLARQPHPMAAPCAAALEAAARRERTAEERDWTRRIEALRRELLASQEEVALVDFGAGSPDRPRTPEEMAAGARVVRTIGEVCGTGSKSPLWCLVLLKLVGALGPERCVEMGTCLGISAAYQATALRLAGRGSLVTLEGAAILTERARGNLERLDLAGTEVVAGPFAATLEGVLAARRPVDYVFVDGHHDGDATVGYHRQISRHLADHALVVYDDIHWSPAMEQA